jgi:signal transduction histidine kinase
VSDEEEVRDGEALQRLRHDLRTPLTIVAGFAEVLAGDRPLTEADRRDYATRIVNAAREIRELIDQALK